MDKPIWFYIIHTLFYALNSFHYCGFLMKTLIIKKESQWIIPFVTCCLLTTGLSLCLVIFNLSNFMAVIFVIPILYAFFFFKDDFSEKVFFSVMMTGLSFSTITFSTLVYSYLHTMLHPGRPDTFFEILLLNSVISITTFLLLYFISKEKKGKAKNLVPLSILTIMNFLLIDIAEIQFTFFERYKVDVKWVLLTSILLFFTSISSIVVYRILLRLTEIEIEKNKIETQQNFEESRIRELENIYSSIRKMKHDIKKHTSIIRESMKTEQMEDSKKYLDEIENSLIPVFSTGSMFVDSELSIKILEIQEKKIRFDYQLTDLSDLPLSDYELCTVFSNLLDNAIEATENLTEESREIKLRVHFFRDMLLIECKNKAAVEHIKKKGSKFLTIKRDSGHGLGIAIIEDLVKKHDGTSSFEFVNGVFTVRIMLPVSK